MIYLDNAATTKTRPEVIEAMLPFLTEEYGNASSIYSIARTAKKAIEKAREQVAGAINADKNDIFFTSGGTEANNWAIFGAAKVALERGGRHIITSKTEHHAVLHVCSTLEKEGFEVTYLDVDAGGFVAPKDFAAAIRPDTFLATIMFANNEIGTIQPIAELAAIARERGVLFHTDAVQAVGHIPVDITSLGVDMLSLSGHKIYAPKGVGALYCKKSTKIAPYLFGGAQEKKRRAGTENVAGIVGLGEAAHLAAAEIEKEAAHAERLRDMLIDGIFAAITDVQLNGSIERRLPGNVNISFSFIEGEALLLHLDMKGICASSGSACTSGSLDPSHVLLAIGCDHARAHGSLRMTIGRYNTEDEIKEVLSVLPPIVQKLRDMSPLR